MTHDEIRERLQALADGELGRSEAQEVEAHLAGCPDCRALRGDIERTNAFLEFSLGALSGAPSARAGVLSRLADPALEPILDPPAAPRPRRLAWLGLAASFGLAAVVVATWLAYGEWGLGREVALEVGGTPRFVPGARGRVLVRTVRVVDGEPAPGRRIALWLATREVEAMRLGSFETGEDGTVLAEFAVPEGIPDRATLRVRDEVSGRERSFDVSFADPVRIALATDRPIYRPGETLRVRTLLARAADRMPLAEAVARIEVRDGEGRLLLREEHTTSAHGLAFTELPLDPEVEPGVYEVRVESEGSEARSRVAVRRFQKPFLAVEGTVEDVAGKGWLGPGDRARLVVEARYAFGQPVVDPEILVDGRRFELEGGEGRWSHEFALPAEAGRFAFEGDRASESLEVLVRDRAGNEAAARVGYEVSRHAVRLEVVPAGGERLAGHPEDVYFHVTDPAGRPIAGSIVHRGREVELRSGYARLRIDPAAGDLYQALEIRTREGAIRRVVGWLASSEASERPVHAIVRSPRVAAGEPIELEVRSADPSVRRVDLHVVVAGTVAASRSFDLGGEWTAVSLETPEGVAGPADLVWSVPGRGPAGRRAIWIEDPAPLVVEAALSVAGEDGEYRVVGERMMASPGRPARLDVRVRDASGEPVTGALSLAGVDSRLFLLPDLPPDERAALAPERPAVAAGLEGEALQVATGIWLARRMSAGEHDAPFLAGEFEDSGRVRRRAALARYLAAYLSGVIVLAGLVWFLVLRLATGRSAAACLLAALVAASPFGFSGGCGKGEEAAPGSASKEARDVTSVPYLGSGARSGETPDASPPVATSAAEPAMRKRFPETLLWEPEILVAGGEARFEFELADSMTTWRVDGWALDLAGRSAEWRTEVAVGSDFFAEFEPPARLTRGDEVEFPVTVFNFTGSEVEAEATASGDGFEFLDGPVRRVRLERGANRVAFRIAARRIGDPPLSVRVAGGGRVDALEKHVHVEGEGQPVEVVACRTVSGEWVEEIAIPAEAVPDTAKILARVHAGPRGEYVDGLEGLIRLPHGCFEQTVSIAWPNALALLHLERSGKAGDEFRRLALERTRMGYQRMLGFQDRRSGGFALYPGQRPEPFLTAMGLAALADLERALGWIDPGVVERARAYVRSTLRSDGSWEEDPTLTAYVAWALSRDPGSRDMLRGTLRWLEDSRDVAGAPYELALVAGALAATDPGRARPVLERLLALAARGPEGERSWGADGGTITRAHGLSASVETTALAAIALGDRPEAGEARAWLLAHRDAAGGWGSSQATVLALQALLPAVGPSRAGQGPIEVAFAAADETGRHPIGRAVLAPGREEVLELVDLTEALASRPDRKLLIDSGGATVAVQIVRRWHVPGDRSRSSGLALALEFGATEMAVGEVVEGRVAVTNGTGRATSALIVQLPVPPGFAPDARALEDLGRRSSRVEEAPGGDLLVYLEPLPGEGRIELVYRLVAVRRGRVAAPAAEVWEYYSPESRADAGAVAFAVR